jgi:hypothetical protein
MFGFLGLLKTIDNNKNIVMIFECMLSNFKKWKVDLEIPRINLMELQK